MKIILQLLLAFFLMSIVSCSRPTVARISSEVELGMTKEEVLELCGPAYNRSLNYDKNGVVEETWYYKEKVRVSGVSAVKHLFIFKEDVLFALKQGQEDSHFNHHDEGDSMSD